MNIDFKFNEEDLVLKFFKYNNFKIGILILYKDGNLWGPATLNVEDARVKKNEIIVKDYDMNYGLYDALINANIINYKRKDLIVGVKTAKICKLKDEIILKLNNNE